MPDSKPANESSAEPKVKPKKPAAAKAKAKGKAKSKPGPKKSASAKKTPARVKSSAKSPAKAPAKGRTGGKTKKPGPPPRPEQRDLADPAVRAALKAKNLKRFEETARGLFTWVSQHTPMSKLVVSDDGQPDVIFEGRSFYDGRHDDYIAEQLEAFWKMPKRMRLQPLHPTSMDDIAGSYLYNVLHAATEKAGLTFNVGHGSNESYFLYTLGLGLGAHIPELIETTDCKALAIVDPNPEMMVHSMEVFDWCWLFDTIDAREGMVSVFINNNPNALALELRNWLRGINPMSVDGSTCYFHYNNPVFNSAMDKLTEDRDLILSGLGFFYDETLMMTHTHHALYPGTERVYMRPENQRLDAPVFVIGNGPSLDNDLEFIRENQDKAVIVSSGSALRPLVLNGILPDFQMETENIDVRPLIAQVAEDHDISSVNLVTSTTVDTEVPPFFDTVLYYFRGSLSPFPVFCDTDRRCLGHPNPTVVNASLSFAQELGFKTFYFFGTDMGTVMGEDKHHSKDAYQYTEGAITRKFDYNIPVPGNFGGTCMASDGMYWTRDAAQKAIREVSRGRTYYNCSDGARIDGTLPMPSKLIKLKDLPGGKQPVIDQIRDCFPVYDSDEFDSRWDDDKMQEVFNDWLDEFTEIVIDQPRFDDLNYLSKVMALLRPTGEMTIRDWGAALVYRGTMFQILMGFEFYARRLPKGDLNKFGKISKKELKAVVKELRKQTKEKFGTLSKDAAKRRKKPASKSAAPKAEANNAS